MTDTTWTSGLSPRDIDLSQRGLFTLDAAAAFAGGVSGRWLREAIKAGRLKAQKVGKRWIVTKRDLEAFLGLSTD